MDINNQLKNLEQKENKKKETTISALNQKENKEKETSIKTTISDLNEKKTSKPIATSIYFKTQEEKKYYSIDLPILLYNQDKIEKPTFQKAIKYLMDQEYFKNSNK